MENSKEVHELLCGLARKFSGKSDAFYMEKDDVFQEAYMRGMMVMDKFDTTRGVKLSTFLYKCMNQRLLNMRNKILKKVTISVERFNDGNDTYENYNPDSLGNSQDMLPQYTETPQDIAIREEEITWMKEVMCKHKLSSRDSEIVGRVVLNGEKYESVGKPFGLSRQRTHQIVQKLLQSLSYKMRAIA